MGRRSLLLAVAVVPLAVACGSEARAPADGDVMALSPPPAIRAVARPARDAVDAWIQDGDGHGMLFICTFPAGGDDENLLTHEDLEEPEDSEEPEQSEEQNCDETDALTVCFDEARRNDEECEPSREELETHLARLREDQREFVEAVRPAPDSEPQVVAELAVATGVIVEFIVWRNAEGELCTLTRTGRGELDGDAGPTGECVPENRCAKLCFAVLHLGDHIVLSATVPAAADELSVKTVDGREPTYPLLGPVVPDSDRRVFLLDLGGSEWERLELRESNDLIERVVRPAEELAFRRCSAELAKSARPPTAGPTDAAVERWKACVESVGGREGWTNYPADEGAAEDAE